MEGEPKFLNWKGWLAVALVAVLLVCGGIQTGWWLGRRALRVEAIKAGHAKHVITDDLGHTDFQWLEKGDK